MAAHIYWRLYITDNNSNEYNCFAELAMYTEIGGSDVCGGGTATSSSVYQSGFEADKAFDNTTTTAWASSANEMPSWVKYQFASAVDIVGFSIWGSGGTAQSPRDFSLQYSDDNTNWTTIASYVGETGWSALEKRDYYFNYGTITGNITESTAISKWIVTANSCYDGGVVGIDVVTGSSYSITCSSEGPVNITLAPYIDRKWATGYTPATGEFWVPSNPDTTPHLFECTTSGAVGGTEPTWNTTPSATTSDGSAVWTCVGPLPTPKALGPRIPS